MKSSQPRHTIMLILHDKKYFKAETYDKKFATKDIKYTKWFKLS